MSKNSDIVELIIKGEDEYSSVSEGVKGELSELSQQAASTRGEMVKLDRALDLTDTYKKQEAEVNRLAKAQAEARHEVDRLKEANKEAKGQNIEVTAALAKATAEYGSLRTATNRAQKDLDKTSDSMRKHGVSVKEVTDNQKAMRTESDTLAKTYTDLSRRQNDLVNAAQRQAAATKAQAAETARIKNATATYRLEMEQLIAQYKRREISGKQFEAGEVALRSKLKLTETQVKSTRAAVGGYTNQIKQLPKDHDKATSSTNKLAAVTQKLAKAYAVLLAARKAAQAVIGAGKAYAEEEKAMLGLKKTTDLTSTELAGLTAELKRLARDGTPTTVKGLLEITEAAGRMGIVGVENILAFAQSTDALASATGMSAEVVAQAIAQILNVTGEAQENVVGVSSAIADLGNKTATTEEQIIHFSKRFAADLATFGLESSKIIGVGAGFAELGVRAEGASTVVSSTMRWIEDAVKSGGEQMQVLGRLTNKTGEEIKQAFAEDKLSLMFDFVQGMGEAQANGESLNSVLEETNLTGANNARILGLMAQQHEKLRKNVAISDAAFKDGTAHLKEQAEAAASLVSGFTMLANRANELKVSMGEAFSDDLTRAIGNTRDGGEGLNEMFAELGEMLADRLEEFAGFAGVVSSNFEALHTLTGGVNVFGAAFSATGHIIDTVTATISMAQASVASLAVSISKFFNKDDAAAGWAKVQEEAFARVEAAIGRVEERHEQMSGRSSRAWSDLRRAYAENTEAIKDMSEEDQAYLKQMIETIGYIEDSDPVYRQYVREIQRTAEVKRILAVQTEKENALLKTNINRLIALGHSTEEAAEIAKKASAERKQAAEEEKKANDEAKKSADERAALEKLANEAAKKGLEGIGAAAENLDKQLAAGEITQEEYNKGLIALAKAANDLDEKALSALGISLDEFHEGISKAENLTLESFKNALNQGTRTTKQVGMLIDSLQGKIKSPEAYEQAKKIAEDWSKSQINSTEIVDDKLKELEATTKSTFKAFTDEITKAATTEALNALAKDLESAFLVGEISIEEYNEALYKVVDRQRSLQSELDKTAISAKKTGEAAKEAAKAAEEGAAKATTTMAGLGGIYDNLTSKLANLSRKTLEAFQSMRGVIAGPSDEIEIMQRRMDSLTSSSQAFFNGADFSGIGRAINDMANQAGVAEVNFLKQKIAVEQLLSQYAQGDTSARAFSMSVEDLEQQFDLLDQQDLNRLTGAVRSVQSQVDGLTNSLKSTVSSLRQELASLQGDTEQVEQLRQAEKKLELEEQYRKAQAIGDSETLRAASEALSLLDQTHKLRMAQVKEQADARREEDNRETRREELERQRKEAEKRDQAAKTLSDLQTTSSIQTKMVTIQLLDPKGRTIEGQFEENQADAFLKLLEEMGRISR